MTQSKKYTGSYKNAYSVITTLAGNYMLRYSKETWPTPEDGGKYDQDRLDKWDEWYLDKYTKLKETGDMDQRDVESIFTQFLKEVVKIDGLDLYKINSGTYSVSKLEFDRVGFPVKSDYCP
nr:hypothetical protein NOHGKDMN_00004 [uncultured bacterium]